MTNKARVISIINWKGGVGKTTFTHHIATGLQHLEPGILEKHFNKRTPPKVLVIDMDAQCNLSVSCLMEDKFEQFIREGKEQNKGIKCLFKQFLYNNPAEAIKPADYILKHQVRKNNQQVYENIDLIPSHPDLIYTDMEIAAYTRTDFDKHLVGSDIYKFQMLNKIINNFRNNYDLILIDCPPNLNFLTQNALYASDYYLIPTILDTLSSYGLMSIKNKVTELNNTFYSKDSNYIKTKLLGIITNSIIETKGQPKNTQMLVLNKIQSAFPNLVFDSYLTQGDGISKASAHAYPVFAFEKSSKNAAKQSEHIRKIITESLDRMKGANGT
ncbi:Sporulation initiation inhibitor protein Soj [Paraliobacillus sp. PM-2]|uniref:ParA family protein n=1 Tax=Paraliobacillus sp. PM-2 TaxID=1462524 RepID=UPI00061C8B95|nr:ParA family protein [Paraliobacillus sp. PM-2]CQR46291.1 Sporulation initiation inhibitor protein Soj [Paraliobacillus sp. PM-2]